MTQDINTILAYYIVNQYESKDYIKASEVVTIQDINNAPHFKGVFAIELNDSKHILDTYSQVEINRSAIKEITLSNAYIVYYYDIVTKLNAFKEREKLSWRKMGSFFNVSFQSLHRFCNHDYKRLGYAQIVKIELIYNDFIMKLNN